MVKAISENRVVPVQEDLTLPETRLEVLRGLENANRVDYPLADGAAFELGEWAVLNADGKLERASATAVANTLLLFTGTDRFDVKATGGCTTLQNSGLVVRTTKYNPAESYAPGDALTVKDWGTGESSLTKQAGAEPVMGRVVSEGNGSLTFETVRS